jgi:hypothetical protein
MNRARKARKKAEAARLAEELARLSGGKVGTDGQAPTVSLSALPGHLERRADERRQRREDMKAFGTEDGDRDTSEGTPLLDLLLDRAADLNQILAKMDKRGTGEVTMEEVQQALMEMSEGGEGGEVGVDDSLTEGRRRDDLTDDEIRIKIRADGRMEMPQAPSNLPFNRNGSPPPLRGEAGGRFGSGGRGGEMTVDGEGSLMEGQRSMYGGPGTGSRILREWESLAGKPPASSPVANSRQQLERSGRREKKKMWVTGSSHNTLSRAQPNPSGGIGKLATSAMPRAAVSKGHGSWDERHEVYEARNRNGPRWANHKYVSAVTPSLQRKGQRGRRRQRRDERGADGQTDGSPMCQLGKGGQQRKGEQQRKWLSGIEGKMLWAARKGQATGSSNQQQLPSSPMALSTSALRMSLAAHPNERQQRVGTLAVSQRHRFEEMSSYEDAEQPDAVSLTTDATIPIVAATVVRSSRAGEKQQRAIDAASLAETEAMLANAAVPLTRLRIHQLLAVLPEMQRARVLALPPQQRAEVVVQMGRIAALAEQQCKRRAMDAYTTKQRRHQAQAEALAGVGSARAAYAQPSITNSEAPAFLDASGSASSVASSVGAGTSLASSASSDAGVLSEGALSEASWLVHCEETWKIGFNGLTGCPYSGRLSTVPAHVGVLDPLTGEQVVPHASIKPTADEVTLCSSPQRIRSLAAGYRQKRTVTKYFAESGRISRQHSQPLMGTSGFQVFSRDWRNFIAMQSPEATFGRVSQLLALEWRKLDGARKRQYAIRAMAQEQDDESEYGVGYAKKSRPELLLEAALRKAEKLELAEGMSTAISMAGSMAGDEKGEDFADENSGGSVCVIGSTVLDSPSMDLSSSSRKSLGSAAPSTVAFAQSLRAPFPRQKGMGIGIDAAARMGRLPTAGESGGGSSGNPLRTRRPVAGDLMHAMQQSLPHGRLTSPTKKSLWEKGLALQLEAAVDVLLASMVASRNGAVHDRPRDGEGEAYGNHFPHRTAGAAEKVHTTTAELLQLVGSGNQPAEMLEADLPSVTMELQQLNIVLNDTEGGRAKSAPQLTPSPSSRWRQKARARA